ncbi:N-6 DNA methylase [Stieleria sp. TO1_6]|uniref:HsdM family class I SAM-dependent methyltransferase n=1 Tax=Stieleria tagensis TaxID=2956795 RepID=UPI00209BAF43|nr:N-6 DNA methylase [Stieleria tagensis]MCO8121331.1 N-6 DNA methylase [Stieleria tagensis]
MLLKQAAEWLGWPTPKLILDPTGEGASVCAQTAKQKIGKSLSRDFPSIEVNTGILTTEPFGDTSVSPLAIVCEFPSGASDEALREAQRLAWNFSRASILVTLEPHRLMAWSCLQDPQQDESSLIVCEHNDDGNTGGSPSSDQERIRQLLHWVSLITGSLQSQLPSQFPMDGRADSLLLKNLKHVRGELLAQSLPRDFCHDLLARIIFTQFLFHRKDSRGNPFFSKTMLSNRCEGALSRVHANLGSILSDKEETYALFRWMDGRFNGDLFPGKADQTDAERDAAWRTEKDVVSDDHLKLLADMVSGTVDTTDRQLLLWPSYSFDTIPLEFISSVYEEFLNEDRLANKAYYTKPQLVDYVLDAVLPWKGKKWDLQILDPACGSGIFLVKAFQRLIHRWRQKNGRDPLVSDLKPILANNFVGVDINPDAIRVACFSLYLAMADAIDPKHYVTREKVFPRLRGTRLFQADFFNEDAAGLNTAVDAKSYDLVIGNPPWGEGSTRDTSESIAVVRPASGRRKEKVVEMSRAEAWAEQNDWTISNLDIGPLFISKGLQLVKSSGRVAMVQPAPPWLYQRGNPALQIRKKLFESFTVEEVTNLSALRREMFADVIGPSCVMVAGRNQPKPDSQFYYFTPKPLRLADSSVVVTIEPSDVNRITHLEAANDPLIWSVLALGGQRDLQLIRRLKRYSTLAKLKRSGEVKTCLGVIPGRSRQRVEEELRGKRYFDEANFPDDVFLEMDANQSEPWDEPLVTDNYSTDFSAFKNPQLLIKGSFVSSRNRFRAARVRSSDPEWGLVCKKTYVTVRDMTTNANHIDAACLAYNSLFATYFLFMTSSRLGHYITEVPVKELLNLPLPELSADIHQFDSFEQIDEAVRSALSLTKADQIIIDEFLNLSLHDAIRKTPGPSRQPTHRHGDTLELNQFAETFIKVMKSTFGRAKHVSATVYREPNGGGLLPCRMITIHLGKKQRPLVKHEEASASGLLDQLSEFHRDVLKKKGRASSASGIGFQRVAFLLHSSTGSEGYVQNLTIIKPDEYRYWTQTQAMRDADDLAASIVNAAQLAGKNK